MQYPTEFIKTVSVAGGSAQRLSDVLVAGGHTGSMIGVELDLKAPPDASLYVGSSSSVDATTGREILAGNSFHREATGQMGNVVDPTQIYLFLATTKNVGVIFRGL